MRTPWVLSLLSSFLFFLALRADLGGVTGWMAFVPLFFLWDQLRNTRQAFLWSAVTGFFLYLLIGIWLAQVTITGYLILCIILSLYFSIFGWFYKKFDVHGRPYGILILSCLWTFLEYLRSLGPLGFPWFFLGYSQQAHLELIQIVSWGGLFVLSFLIVWVNRALYEIIFYRKIHGLFRKFLWVALSVVFLSASYFYGHGCLGNPWVEEEAGSSRIKIALIQGNILQEEKWDPVQAEWIFKKYQQLTLKAAESHPDLIVWPETSLPSDLKVDKVLKRWIEKLAQHTGSYLLIGGNDDRLEPGRIVTNSAFLISREGHLIDQYDKIHLVPCGEYVPLRRWLPWVANLTLGEIDFTRGREFQVFRLKGGAFSAVICFEDIFPQFVRQFVGAGAQLIVNLTNDAWFGHSRAAEEHLRLSRFVAVANGVGLVRATNTGISAFISPRGEILEKVQDEGGEDLEISGFAVHEMNLARMKTFYQRWGDVFSWVCGFIVIGFLLFIKLKSSVIRG